MKSIHEALAEILPAFQALPPVRLPLQAALGRFLAQPLTATHPLPPFSNSAMDGYAVRAADLAGAGPERPRGLPVRGESRAGGDWPAPLQPGSAMRIFTGAPLPDGADAVVMQEDVERAGESATFRAAPEPGQHVRELGEDLAAGAPLLAPGTRLGPGELGLLASQGLPTVSVHRAPRVALLSTGDELRDLGQPLPRGTIVNSNAYALAALVQEAGGEPWVLPTAPDEREATAAAVAAGLRADVLVSIGGVSVGEYDLVRDALSAAGVSLSFWKVAMKPGKPLVFGRAGQVPVLGLPGNPVSAMVTFEVFLRPGLRRMLGDPSPFRPSVTVRLSHAHRRAPGRTELARATLQRDPDGTLRADLHRLQGSGSLPSMVGVDALVLLPAARAELAAGEALEALLLRPELGASTFPPVS